MNIRLYDKTLMPPKITIDRVDVTVQSDIGQCFICGHGFIDELTGSIFGDNEPGNMDGVCDVCHSEAVEGTEPEDNPLGL